MLTFLVEGQKVPAHKIFLSASSEYFSGMFLSGLSESNSSVVELKDVRYSVFLAIQEYLYTGDAQEISGDIAIELLASANLYNFPRLKAIVVNLLGYSIEVDNACFLLDIANLYRCNSLFESCMIFITQNYRNVLCTESFKELSSDLKNQIVREYEKSTRRKK